MADEEELNELLFLIIRDQSSRWNRGLLMTVGPGMAGKTQLCNSIIGNDFNEEWVSTGGIDNSLTVSIQKADINKENGTWSKKSENENDGLLVETMSRLAALRLDDTIINNENQNQTPSDSLSTTTMSSSPPTLLIPGLSVNLTPPPVVVISDEDKADIRRCLFKN
eukprot:gene18942-26816_t